MEQLLIGFFEQIGLAAVILFFVVSGLWQWRRAVRHRLEEDAMARDCQAKFGDET